MNGVTNLFADLEAGRLVVTPEAAEGADGINVRALYDNNWYVDANNGSDGNPGCAAFPMLTLVEGTRHAASGDTVHAAPGDYNQGETGDHTGFVSISSRVVVVSGVLLVADEGPDVTFITGADSPTPVSQNQYLLPGGGPGAVRCVFLEAGAKISGFTVRHGRQNGGSTDGYDGHSGGILGRGADNSIAYNCVITNCCGYRGGATFGVLAVNCHISGCKSASGSGGRASAFVGCVFGGDCNNNYIDYPSGQGVRNCTFLGPNTAVSNASASCPVCNSIILSKVSATTKNPMVLNSCILNTNAISETVAEFVTTNNCVVCADDLVGLNADGTPQQDSIAVDAGSNTLVSAAHNGVDIAGSQRVYNGVVDIGAYEYDWRPAYAAAINGSQCAVVKASPEVTLGQDGKVSVVDTLAMTLRSAAPSGRSSKYSVPVSVTGNGTLTVTLNGEEYGVFDQGDYLIEFKNALASNDIVLNYAPGAEDTGSAVVDTADVVFNGAIILLK